MNNDVAQYSLKMTGRGEEYERRICEENMRGEYRERRRRIPNNINQQKIDQLAGNNMTDISRGLKAVEYRSGKN